VSFLEWVQVVVGAFVVSGVLVAVVQVFLGQLNERRRNQPVVIAHEERSRTSMGDGNWKVDGYIANEGEGAAFNVRWGVSYSGVRYAYRLNDGDPLSGNRQRVLRPRTRVPSSGSWPVLIPALHLYAGEGVPENTAFYWARYENSQGKTWETINLPDRSASLQIKRVRFPRLREQRDNRHRKEAREAGIEWEKGALAEFRQAREAADAAESEQS
jgi:hypothetical protein